MTSLGHNPDKGEKLSISVDAELEELIPGYIENRLSAIKSITESLSTGDFENIRVHGHSMKGSGNGYGFDRITEIGSAIENAAMDRNHDVIKKCIGELSAYLDNIEIVYE